MTEDRFTGDPREDRRWLSTMLGPGALATIEDQVPRWRASLLERDTKKLWAELRGLMAVEPRTESQFNEIIEHRMHACMTVLQERGAL